MAMNSAPPASPAECSSCGLKSRWPLHRICHRSIDRRHCTSCVLRLHPSSFCPSCFEFFHHPLSAAAHRFLSCVKCSSLTHIHCLTNNNSSASASSFLCPPCASPNFSFFNPKSHDSNGLSFVVDEKLATVFLYAAKIAYANMNKAVAAARVKADRAVREAALALKRAKDALKQFSLPTNPRPITHGFAANGKKDAFVGRRDFNNVWEIRK